MREALREPSEPHASWRTLLPDRPVRLPDGFAWGVASSAFQAEGGEVPNDWVEAARAGRVPANPGNGFWERAEEDLRRVAELGIRHYRLSVEWSRVEPERGRFDEAALDRYRAICDAARAAGLTPWVNLFHFTHPVWLMRRGGLLGPTGLHDFVRYAERVARALAGRVDRWHVQNESMIYVFGGYLLGQLPPWRSDPEAALAMTRVVLEMHAGAYTVLKAVDPASQVVPIEAYLDLHGDPSTVEPVDAWYNATWLEGLATGRLALPGVEPVEIPGLAGACDAYGLNYYSATRLEPQRMDSYSDLPDPPRDAMGRAVHPAGLEAGLARVARALPDVPLLVTENGCPTTDEDFRIRYLAAHLAALGRARRAGADVRGYFHWTAVDNFEWDHGFSDKRFGLIGFDPQTQERHLKASAPWLARVIAAGELRPETLPGP